MTTSSGGASVYKALPQPEASAPPVVVGSPKILGRVIRIPHSGVAVHRVCWFLLLVYAVVCVVWGGDYWGVWVQPPSLVALSSFALCLRYLHPTSSPWRLYHAHRPAATNPICPPYPSCSVPVPSAPSFTASAPHLVLKPPATPAVCCLALYRARTLRCTGVSERIMKPLN